LESAAILEIRNPEEKIVLPRRLVFQSSAHLIIGDRDALKLPRDGLAAPAAPLESPSLALAGAPAAYELKFLLTEAQARAVEARLAARLQLDSHADPALDNCYQTTSLYCDTDQLEVFRGLGSYKRRKHRLRRYDGSAFIFLERKSKWGDRVEKRRVMIPDAELGLLANPMAATTWPGHWFHRHLHSRRLAPICTITYERLAFMARTADGPVRLTFDRRIRGVLAKDWAVEPVAEGTPLLTHQVICEFKYQAFLPALFKDTIQALRLVPSPVSKYRTFMRVLGYGQGSP
jgi:hypothetical protein